jgi:heat shock protein HtpX
MKRVILFVLTNLAVLAVLNVVLAISGLGPELSRRGLNPTSLSIFALIWGMGGATISLLLSKPMAIWSSGARVVSSPSNSTEAWLLETLHRQAKSAGIGSPDLAIFPSSAPNAFATGARKNSALVALSSGLLATMERDEVEAVMGHEVAHIANGDMVTMTLLQGVLNAFVMACARILGLLVDQFLQGSRRDGEEPHSRGPGIGYFLASFLLEMILGLLASLIVMAFSRAREYRADAGGARLAGKGAMIRALRRLQRASEPTRLPANLKAFGITGEGVSSLFRSHPPLEDRIAALEFA